MNRSVPRYCRSCGAAAPEPGRFCPSCGSTLSLTTPYPVPEGVPVSRHSLEGERQRDSLPHASITPTIRPVVTPTLGGSVRMGFGIALGMLLFSVVLVGIVLFGIAMATGLVTWPFADSAQKFEGRGPADSMPMKLGGAVSIEWTASPTMPVACRFGASLLAQNDAGFSTEIASTMIDRTQASGIPRELELAPRSDYFLHVESDCSWTIRVINR
jgi:hypothetical protein